MRDVITRQTTEKVSTRILVGCVPHLADEAKDPDHVRAVLASLITGLRTLFHHQDESFNTKYQGMICVESHNDNNALHYHWAV